MSKKIIFNKGDVVVVPTHGIGKIVNVTKESYHLDLEDKDSHVVVEIFHIECQSLDLKIPKARMEDLGVRSPISADLAKKILNDFSSKVAILNRGYSWVNKLMGLQYMLDSGHIGTLQSLVIILHDLLKEKNGNRSYFELKAFETAMNLITTEIGFVLNKTKEEVHGIIITKLESRARDTKANEKKEESLDDFNDDDVYEEENKDESEEEEDMDLEIEEDVSVSKKKKKA